MLRIYLKLAPPHGVEVRLMASLSRPIDVLKQAALVALDEVVISCPRRPPRSQRAGQLPEHGGLTQHGQPPARDACRGKLRRSGQEMEIVAPALHEGVHQSRRRRLDTSVEGKGAADQGKLHRFAITLSTSGKSSRL